MAKMFPSSFPEDSLSSGERKVFEYFKSNAPDNWFVLHSFRLAKHKSVVFGEADFIVIAPDLGIFALEIKSGGVGYNGTDWVFINRNHEKTFKQRGPFQQAREAMFSIEKTIVEKLGTAYSRTNLIYGYGVIFTDEEHFPLSAITEDETWRLCQKSDNVNYVNFIKKLNKCFIEELRQLDKEIPQKLSFNEAELIAKTLRPSVDCIVPLRSFLQLSEDDIISLTEEQYSCLDDIDINDRIVVTGGAGTGKTLLAVEEARRCSARESVAFFCFNKNLAEYVKSSISSDNVTVYSLHAFLTKLCGDVTQDLVKDEGYFDELLPEIGCDIAKRNDICFDRIIVDEFQDLFTNNYLHFFDTILKNGLLDGKFSFFGDFARQTIYNGQVSLDILNNYTFFAKKHLSINCRNTKFIGNELINITGYTDKMYKLQIDGEPVDYYVWDSKESETDLLLSKVKNLRGNGFSAYDIMILSPLKREKSIVGECDTEKYLIGDFGDNPTMYYAMFSTIQAFKGLESKIVILVDIDEYSDAQLMYIALSRARSKLIVLESTKASKLRKKLTIER